MVYVLVVFYTHKYTAIYLIDIATLTKSYIIYIEETGSIGGAIAMPEGELQEIDSNSTIGLL